MGSTDFITELPEEQSLEIFTGSISLGTDGKLVLSYEEDGQARCADLSVDAKTFQFRSNGNDKGEVGTLKDVTGWNYRLAGEFEIYVDGHGSHFISDGHQRAGHAIRELKSGRADKLSVRFFLLKQDDGWSPKKAMVASAIKNMAQNTAHPMDIALALRKDATLDLLSRYVPPHSKAFVQAKSLALLDDDIFGMFLHGSLDRVPVEYGVEIGKQMPFDAEKQRLALNFYLNLKSKDRPQTLTEMALFVGEIRDNAQAREIKGKQLSMFGYDSPSIENTAMFMRYKIKAHAVKRVGRIARMFTLNAGNAQEHRRELGTEIDVKAHQSAAHKYKILKDNIGQQFFLKGSVSDALSDAVADYMARPEQQRGSHALNEVTDQFIERCKNDPKLMGSFNDAGSADLTRGNANDNADNTQPHRDEKGDHPQNRQLKF